MIGLGEVLLVVGGAFAVLYGVYRLGYRVGRAEGKAEVLSQPENGGVRRSRRADG